MNKGARAGWGAVFVAAILLPSSVSVSGQAQKTPGEPYLDIVRKFADTLIEKGRDRYGPKKTALWCGVIKLDDFSVPQDAKDAPIMKGFRAQDRAVGGCNLHHDVSTLYTFRALSRITGDPKYQTAVVDYLRDYLAVAQHPRSGLIAWGEHMYYELYGDIVHQDYGRSGRSHELVEYTPPWDLLYEVDPKATARAIEGIKYHFFGEDPARTGWMFNRHGSWDGRYSVPKNSQPWIKHAGLFAYSYAFLYSKTQHEDAKIRQMGTSQLYWNNRNPQTNLAPVCLPVPNGGNGHLQSDMTSFTTHSYFLLKAGQIDPTNAAAREHAMIMLKAFAKYSWDEQAGTYRDAVNGDGTPNVEPDPKKLAAKSTNPWSCTYGNAGLLRFGRIAAYASRTENDAECLLIARRCAAILKATPLPQAFTPEEVGFGIHLNLDLFDQTGEKTYVTEASNLARIAVEKLWSDGLFRRVPGDRFYESKVGPGDLASALLRLSLRLDSRPQPDGVYDWSF